MIKKIMLDFLRNNNNAFDFLENDFSIKLEQIENDLINNNVYSRIDFAHIAANCFQQNMWIYDNKI